MLNNLPQMFDIDTLSLPVVKEEEICCVCLGEQSEPPNEIVICDNCNQGKMHTAIL